MSEKELKENCYQFTEFGIPAIDSLKEIPVPMSLWMLCPFHTQEEMFCPLFPGNLEMGKKPTGVTGQLR